MKLIEFQKHYLFILLQFICYLMSHVYNRRANEERGTISTKHNIANRGF